MNAAMSVSRSTYRHRLGSEDVRKARILITKHRRPIATLSAADMEHVHVGPRFGRGTLKPLLRAPTQGKYLEVLEDDRRPSAGRR